MHIPLLFSKGLKIKSNYIKIFVGRDSSVGTATRYGMDGSGIESRWGGGEIFRTCPDRPWGTPGLLYNEYRDFSGVKRPGRGVDHPSPSSAEVKGNSRAILLLPLWSFVAFSRVTFNVNLILK